MSTLRDVSNISILMGLFLFIYMLIGMELFAYKVPIKNLNVGEHQSNFNNILDAFLSVFIVLANNGWMTLFLDHYRATDSYLASAFFISLLIIGQLILLNLFVAILIENFEQLSIRNDLVSKLSNLKKGTFTEQVMDMLRGAKEKVRTSCCCCLGRKENKVVEESN